MATDGYLSQLLEQWEGLQHSDAARNRLIAQFVDLVTTTEEENRRLKDDIEIYQLHEKNYKNDRKSMLIEFKDLRERLAAAPFVIVLIDGDGSLFLDDFIKAGAAGGREAAQSLYSAVKVYLKDEFDLQPHWNIFIRIYANQHGLCDAYNRAGVADARTVQSFFVGFNRELPLAEYVDVGSDKEAADNKIRENLRAFSENVGCKHLMLAGSADRGYVSFLRQFSAVSENLTLVESIPFPASFRDLASLFPTKTFDKVFRNEKLVIKEPEVPRQAAAVQKTSYAIATATAPRAPTPSPQSRSPGPPKTQSPAPQPSTENDKPGTKAAQRSLRFNQHGQRVDAPLPLRDPIVLQKLRPLKLCSRYYLSCCSYEQVGCKHNHDPKLTDREKVALAHLARENVCSSGLHCEDRDCVAGHQCPKGESCIYGYSCRYPEELHGIDKKVVETV